MKKITVCFLFIGIVLYNTVSAQAPVRKVLLEEFTTASCGMCPPATKYVNTWHDAHSASTILVTIHQGSGVDAMSSAPTTAIFNAMHPTSWFAPAIMIDRGVYPSTNGEAYLSTYKSFGSTANPGIDSIATRLMNEPAKVGLDISGTYNSSSRTINATVKVKFFSAVPTGDWRINLFLVEDSVIGWPGFGCFKGGWDQKCYDATWANTNYPGKFDGTYIIGYPHRHVMREALLGDWGKQSVIPSVPIVGTIYTTVANLVVDTAYREKHLSLVAFVSSYGGTKTEKYVLNANQVELKPTFATGIEDNYISKRTIRNSIDYIYPVPSNYITYITYTLAKDSKSEISINNMIGQQVQVLNPTYQKAGQYQISFDASKFAKGVYYVSLKTDLGIKVKEFIVQ